MSERKDLEILAPVAQRRQAQRHGRPLAGLAFHRKAVALPIVQPYPLVDVHKPDPLLRVFRFRFRFVIHGGPFYFRPQRLQGFFRHSARVVAHLP